MSLAVFTSPEGKRVLFEELSRSERVSESVLQGISRITEDESGFLLRDGGTVVGGWSALWDTDHFGYPVGNLTVWDVGRAVPGMVTSVVDAGVGAARDRGWRLIYSRIEAGLWREVHALEAVGFRLMDQLVTFVGPTILDMPQTSTCRIRPLMITDEGELQAVETLGAGAFGDSRFYRDPNLDRTRVDELFRRWTASIVRRGQVFVAEVESQIAGYVACSTRGEDVVIELIAVAEWARGRGIGAALVRTVQSAYHGSASRLSVGTQLTNRGAVALYTGCGLKLKQAQISFHLWLK